MLATSRSSEPPELTHNLGSTWTWSQSFVSKILLGWVCVCVCILRGLEPAGVLKDPLDATQHTSSGDAVTAGWWHLSNAFITSFPAHGAFNQHLGDVSAVVLGGSHSSQGICNNASVQSLLGWKKTRAALLQKAVRFQNNYIESLMPVKA